MAKPTSLEARRRAEGILREMEKAVPPPGQRRALRAAEILEWLATKEARTLLLKLAKGAPDARLTREAAAACKRLERRKYTRRGVHRPKPGAPATGRSRRWAPGLGQCTPRRV